MINVLLIGGKSYYWQNFYWYQAIPFLLICWGLTSLIIYLSAKTFYEKFK